MASASRTLAAARSTTSTRFNAFFGTALRGRVAYALGYAGLGVRGHPIGADVMLDLLSGKQTRRRLAMVRTEPIPFPPEPLRYLGIELTRASLARDRNDGKRNLWLRGLDAVRIGIRFIGAADSLVVLRAVELLRVVRQLRARHAHRARRSGSR